MSPEMWENEFRSVKNIIQNQICHIDFIIIKRKEKAGINIFIMMVE